MKAAASEGSIDATTVTGNSSIDRTIVSGESAIDNRFNTGEYVTEFEANAEQQQGFDYSLDFDL